MKKRFISKRKKKYRIRFLFLVFLFVFSLYKTFNLLLKSDLKVDNKILVNFLLNNTYKSNSDYINDIYESIKKDYSPTKLLMTSYYDIKIPKKEISVNKNSDYIIYVYNTHQSEEYAPNSLLEQEINPTVMMASFIMEDVFNKNNYKTLVEERSIKEILNRNKWKYYRSYDASRIYLEDSKEKYKTLKYFIDVHRDSLEKEKTTITINDKNYAKIIFLLGGENPNYLENKEFIEKINNKIIEKYPNLSKGIYKKEGAGVNGVYNQDNSKYTILVEIGGYENTTDEVLNTTLAFTECFLEVIKDEK